MRDFRDYLSGSGYDITWLELPEGHSWGQWRATIDVMVPYFFPPEFLGTEETAHPRGTGIQVTPNPANAFFHYSFSLESTTDVKIRLFASSGEMVYEKQESLPPGPQLNQIDASGLAPGVYVISVNKGKSSVSKKILITK
jgi:enterochelin esterase family protein